MPGRYSDDRGRAEAIILEATRRHALDANTIGEEVARSLDLRPLDFQPRVYYRLTSSWIGMMVRFVYRDHGTRAVKDQIVRDIMAGLDAAGLAIASAAYAIVAAPAIELAGAPEASRPDRYGRTDSERGDAPA